MTTLEATGLDPTELLLLRAVRETGALEALLQTAGTPQAVAAETGITERAARIAAEALDDMGFLRLVDGEYEPTNRALGFLATRDPRSIGRVPHALDLLECFAALPETMRTGEPPVRPDGWTTHEVGADAARDRATVRACVTAALKAAPGAETVLDICGGSGVHATELADRGRDVTLLDDPEVLERVEPMLAGSDVDCVADSLDDLDLMVDLAMAVDLCWSLSSPENRLLVAGAAEVLVPGGTLVLIEPLRDRSGAATATAVRALATGDGDCYAAETVTDWCRAAGLTGVRVEDVPGTHYQAVVARRDAS